MDPTVKRRVYYDFNQHRIGDKVAISAALHWHRARHPEDFLIAVDDFWFGKGIQRAIPSRVVFEGLVDECVYNTTPPDAERLDFGCIWIRVPWLAKQGFYPSIRVSGECEARMFERFRWMTDPYVCVHILEDAAYNRRRNHSLRQMAELIRILSERGARVVRVGKWLGSVLKRITDLTPCGLSVMESACIVKNSICFIGGDTGMTHVASAVGVERIVAIYGPPLQPEQRKKWRKVALEMGCDADFCSWPSVPEERRSVFHMQDHQFSMTEVVDACTKHLREVNVI